MPSSSTISARITSAWSERRALHIQRDGAAPQQGNGALASRAVGVHLHVHPQGRGLFFLFFFFSAFSCCRTDNRPSQNRPREQGDEIGIESRVQIFIILFYTIESCKQSKDSYEQTKQ